MKDSEAWTLNTDTIQSLKLICCHTKEEHAYTIKIVYGQIKFEVRSDMSCDMGVSIPIQIIKSWLLNIISINP